MAGALFFREKKRGAGMENNLFKAEKISAGYGRKNVFSELDLELKKGTCTMIVGANGCGKSTLLAVLAGIKRKRAGIVKKEFGVRIGYVPQKNPFLAELSAYDHLLLWAGNKKEYEKKQKDPLIMLLGLDEFLHKRVDALSEGMAKRLMLACAFMQTPNVLFLDEPTAALDLECKVVLRKVLREYLLSGGTICMCSHDEGDFILADDMYVLKDGKMNKVNSEASAQELTALF